MTKEGNVDALAELMARGLEHYKDAKFQEALTVWLEARTFAENAFGPDHIETATVLRRLATVYEHLNEWANAKALHEQSIAILERHSSPDDPEIARSYNNFGIYHWSLGQLPEALDWFTKSLGIHERNHGPQHPLVGATVMNIGMVYANLGEPVRAAEAAERAAQISEAAYGEHDENTALAINNAGGFHLMAGNLERSRELLERALALRLVIHGPTHPYTTSTEDNLGELHQQLGNFETALRHYQHALEANRNTYGEHHPEVGRVENNIGSLYSLLGQPDRAIDHLERALRGYALLGGLEHPTTLDLVSNLAEAHLTLNRPSEALAVLGPAVEAFLKFQSRYFPALDVTGKVRYNTTARLLLGLYLRASANASPTSGDPTASLSAWLTFKGSAVAFETSFALAEERADPATSIELAALRSAHLGLAEVALQAVSDSGQALERQQHLAEAAATVSRLEVALSGHLLELQEALELRQLTSADLLSALAPGEVYLDYALLGDHLYSFAIDLDRRVTLLDLGPAEPVTATISALRLALGRPNGDYHALTQTLFAQIISPLKAMLEGASGLVIAPDGALHFLPFELLGDSHGTLLERLEVHVVPSGRDLIRLHRHGHTDAPLEAPALFGDPDFLDATLGDYRSGDTALSQVPAGFSDWLRKLRFPKLRGSRREVETIARLLPKARLYVGLEFKEENLFEVRNPSVLHLATHTYVYDGAEELPNPLLRICISLTGARMSALEGRSRGLVSALSLSGLRLRGTSLVVLSACRTALGEVRQGEGVAGLNQAFFIAGARGVVSGLWPVPDEETATMMIAFYRRLTAGMKTGEALRQTKLELAQTLHPHFWAAFVLSGTSTSLDVASVDGFSQ